MYTLIVVLAVVVSILLAAIVLVQESKGGGLASSVAGANSVLGVRKTTDFVEKATWSLAGILVVLAIASSFFVAPAEKNADDIVNDIKTSAPAPQLPGQPAPAPAPGQYCPWLKTPDSVAGMPPRTIPN